jgi:nicotinamide phosphoribosyltransferase
VVSDSYDVFNAVSELWGKRLKDAVLRSGATLVVRPDSGNPS